MLCCLRSGYELLLASAVFAVCHDSSVFQCLSGAMASLVNDCGVVKVNYMARVAFTSKFNNVKQFLDNDLHCSFN